MDKEPLHQWENGAEYSVVFNGESKLNASSEPTAIPNTDFSDMMNLCKSANAPFLFVKRNAFRKISVSQMVAPDESIYQIKEVVINAKRFLIARPLTGAKWYYMAFPYNTGWTELFTATNTLSLAKQEIVNAYSVAFLTNLCESARPKALPVQAISENAGALSVKEYGYHPATTYEYTLQETTGGNLTLLKTYYYALTLTYEDAWESDTIAFKYITLTGSNSAVRLMWGASLYSFPTPQSRVTKINVYRSKGLTAAGLGLAPPPEMMYYLGSIDVPTGIALTDIFYVDTKADEALAIQRPIEDLTAHIIPYRAKCGTIIRDRLVLGNLSVDERAYSPLPESAIEVTSGSGSLGAGTYYYYISKVYYKWQNGKWIYVTGEPLIVEKTVGASSSVTIKYAGILERDFTPYCRHLLIEKSHSGTNKAARTPYAILQYMDYPHMSFTDTGGVLSVPSEVTHGSYQSAGDKTEVTELPTGLAISDAGDYEHFVPFNLLEFSKQINAEVTGVFEHNDKMIVFTNNNIYRVDTEPIDPKFWAGTKVVEGIGAQGAKKLTTDYTFGAGHSGILQLPKGSGFMFFNKTVASSLTDKVVLYYWDGENNNVTPVSNEVSKYLSGVSPVIIRDMAHDAGRQWVWISLYNGNHVILIFDMLLKQWYRWEFTPVPIDHFNAFATLLNGEMIGGTENGWVYEYKDSVFSDEIEEDAFELVTAYLETKEFNFPESLIVGTTMKIQCETNNDVLNLYTAITGDDNAHALNGYVSTDNITRVVEKFNVNAKKVKLMVMFTNYTDLKITGLTAVFKQRHKRHG